MITPDSVVIKNIGERKIRSPLPFSTSFGDGIGNFTPDTAKVLFQTDIGTGADEPADIFFEKAGAREYIYFNPKETRAAIVTCGGLCPGLNNVIRSCYRQLGNYGVNNVLGIRYGYAGLAPKVGWIPPMVLTADVVEDIHKEGGSILGSSRGKHDVGIMVDYLLSENVNILFCIGGDGTQHGAHLIAEEAMRRKADLVVIGIPKTIDNDIMYTSRSFGYNTALEMASEVLHCAHAEARGAPYGIGLVKLMGRDSGFIAAGATLANQEVNFTLVPEVPFDLHGKNGLLPLVKKRLLAKRHAVIAVAEGAGQDLIPSDGDIAHDASGNVRYKDIGLFIKDELKAYFKAERLEANIKYIDPSYIIRSVPANSDDSLFCDLLARHAVHTAMAGKTDLLIGQWHDAFIHVPIALAIEEKKRIDPESELWISVHEASGQPLQFKKKDGVAE